MMLMLLVQDHRGYADIICFHARSLSAEPLNQATHQGFAFIRGQPLPGLTDVVESRGSAYSHHLPKASCPTIH